MSGYIGSSYRKKLKKLYRLSRGIIHLHGMRYYIYVIYLELKKNGFAVFALDQKPISRFQEIKFIEKYTNYLKHLNKKLLKERLDNPNKISYMPLISIILIINDKNFDDLKNTIDSIKNQTYDNWQIIIFRW